MTCKNVPALWKNINHLKEMGIGQMSTPYRRQKYISSLLQATPDPFKKIQLSILLESKHLADLPYTIISKIKTK